MGMYNINIMAKNTTFNDSFNRVATDYHKIRQQYPYPAYILDALVNGSELTPNDQVLELGAGTGILTNQLLRRKLRVVGIEPGDNLRAIAEQELARDIRNGRAAILAGAALDYAEDGSLGIYDGLAIGTAMRWLGDRDTVCNMIYNHLRPPTPVKPGGAVAVTHNTNEVADNGGNEFYLATRGIYGQFMPVSNKPLPHAAELVPEGFGGKFEPVLFKVERRPLKLSPQQYVDLIQTYNPVIQLAPRDRAELVRRLYNFVLKETEKAAITHGVTLEIARRKN